MTRRLAILLPLLTGLAPATPPAAESPVDYNRDVRPILSTNCFPCHGPDEEHREMELRLDRRDSAVEDRNGYQVVAPGRPDDSELIYRVTTDSEFERMPPEHTGRTLSSDEVAVLRRWIEQGAGYARHWSLVPPVRPQPPAPRAGFHRNAVDAFTAAHMTAHGLEPGPEADRETLIRRLSLDLIGLPPVLDEVDAFLEDTGPDAYQRLVDRLLAKLAYGERWARVWLDLARYADSKGYGSDPLRTIWRYRDWVIEAYNANLPFDQFTIQQLAGDLLPDATMEQRLATAFHRNTMTNTEGGTDDEEFRVAAVKDRVNTTAQVWLGMTAGCAQCHSHKFDALSHHEYYSLFAFFNQTEDRDLPNDDPRLETPTREQQARRAALDREITGLDAILVAPGEERLSGFETWSAHARALEGQWAEVTSENTGDGAVTVSAPGGLLTALRVTLADSDSDTDSDWSRVRLFLVRSEAVPVHGRRLRIRIPGPNRILSLAEVEVLSGGRNVAREGEAQQSSTAYQGPPGLAIDGNRSGAYDRDRSVTHTETEADPWWEVDLGRVLPIDSVVLWNRTDGDLERRLDDFEVEVFDASGGSLWKTLVTEPPEPDLALRPGRDDLPLALRPPTRNFTDAASLDGADAVVVWELDEAVEVSANAPLRIEGPWPAGASLRLAVTGAASPVRAVPLEVAQVLATEPDDRAAAERQLLLTHYATFAPELDPLRERRRQAAKERAAPAVMTPVMRERPAGQHRQTHVLIKGNFLTPGDPVEPTVPAALHPWPDDAPRDRLGLARWLVHRDNPLTARVSVNRLWACLFGRGLVETEEDFGTQGRLPSHPLLLDWLAVEFMENGWDQKALLKTIVTSATYRQRSTVTAEHLRKDPANRWLARGARFRHEAEVVRDQALAIAGLLSPKMFGPSVFPPQPAGLWQAAFNNADRNWTTSPGEDRHRRAVYTFLRRTVPYPSMTTFDAPSRELCTMRRMRTNTPLQAFVTLNDPVFVEAAQALARRMLAEGGDDDRARLRHGWRLATGRRCDDARLATLTGLLDSAREEYRTRPAEATRLATDPLGPLPASVEAPELAAWTVVGNVLLNLDALLTRG